MNFSSRYFAPRYFAPRYFGTKRPTVLAGGLIIQAPIQRRWTHVSRGGLHWGGAAAAIGVWTPAVAPAGLRWGGAALMRWIPTRYALARQEDVLWLWAL